MSLPLDKLKKMRRIGLMDGAYFAHKRITDMVYMTMPGMSIDEKEELHKAVNVIHGLIGKKQHRLMTELDNAATEKDLENILWTTT